MHPQALSAHLGYPLFFEYLPFKLHCLNTYFFSQGLANPAHLLRVGRHWHLSGDLTDSSALLFEAEVQLSTKSYYLGLN